MLKEGDGREESITKLTSSGPPLFGGHQRRQIHDPDAGPSSANPFGCNTGHPYSLSRPTMAAALQRNVGDNGGRSRHHFRRTSTASVAAEPLRVRANCLPTSPLPSGVAPNSARPSPPSFRAVPRALDAELPGAGWPWHSLTELLQPQPTVAEWRLLAPVIRQGVVKGGKMVRMVQEHRGG